MGVGRALRRATFFGSRYHLLVPEAAIEIRSLLAVRGAAGPPRTATSLPRRHSPTDDIMSAHAGCGADLFAPL